MGNVQAFRGNCIFSELHLLNCKSGKVSLHPGVFAGEQRGTSGPQGRKETSLLHSRGRL